MTKPNGTRRRDFMTGSMAALGGAGLLAASGEAAAQEQPVEALIKPGATILFQGDSITDTGRNRAVTEANDPSGLGSGYAFLSAAQLLVDRPDDDLKIYNRGVSGNKVFQLDERWQPDCFDLQPDLVSILIGVNDIWHGLNGEYDGTIDTYRDDYLKLAARTRDALPEAKLVVCEPFVLKVGAVDDRWFPQFDEYRAAARQVADEFADAWVPFQSLYTAAEKFAPAEKWVPDGVHPTQAAAALMANAWLRAVGV